MHPFSMYACKTISHAGHTAFMDRRKGTASRERMEYPKAKREENDD